ncbi:MAG: LexA family transcriptional regulator [Thiobacillaceae bacterium]|nr:LexA family transcriptional regulator [Thiobacillaceae bacterium]MCX7672073.1 LexA family transcriptional regulator [Thiobacillaceae bacterium]MDW8324334.1 LexA family transcriptional regulator [Burkholderiales bacterium]
MSHDALYLAQLQDYYARHRVFPPYSGIGALLGLKSKSSVAALIARLRLEGFLDATPDRRLKPGPRFFERTLADSVRAGLPQAADDSARDTLTLDEYLIEHPSRTVLVRVKGDSMVEAGIHPGDIAVVERTHSARPGDLVVAIVDEEFTLKRLARDRDGYLLMPANPAYPPIRPKGSLELFGVVVGIVRKYKGGG